MAENTKVRDTMAIHRTKLANERTLLAYWRTSLAFIIAGAVILRLDHTTQSVFLSGALIFLGVIVLGYGFYRFKKYRKKIV